jgi:hypothetical protein
MKSRTASSGGRFGFFGGEQKKKKKMSGLNEEELLAEVARLTGVISELEKKVEAVHTRQTDLEDKINQTGFKAGEIEILKSQMKSINVMIQSLRPV